MRTWTPSPLFAYASALALTAVWVIVLNIVNAGPSVVVASLLLVVAISGFLIGSIDE